MHYSVCIVGAGPAGLTAAIRFKQLQNQQEATGEKNKQFSVCVIEKGAEVGAHILSGNVFEPRALDELLPEWRDDPTCPITACPVTKDRFYLLTKRHKIWMPTPPQMRGKGKNYVVSLSQVTRWLACKAEELGVEIYSGFAGSSLMYSPDGSVVRGVRTNEVGVGRNGKKKDTYTTGMELTADVTLLAEGCRGSLSQEIIKKFGLREAAGADPQTYALGIKEVWEVAPDKAQPGTVWHTVGWPLPQNTYGGGWVYHMGGGAGCNGNGNPNRVSLGLVVGLDYTTPYLSPYQEFQQFKRHPAIAGLLRGGTCVEYGARTLNEGGWQSIPALAFMGGALIGDAAGFLNVPKIKGTHTAMKSGMVAAECAYKQLTDGGVSGDTAMAATYPAAISQSWIHTELYEAKNIRPGFSLFGGLWGGMAYAALDTYVLRGRAKWTLHHRRPDHEALVPAAEAPKITYPKPDNELTFDLATSLHRSGTNHEHDQPAHLKLRNAKIPTTVNVGIYDGPETRYCPAGVYEYDEEGRLQINAQNCLHCKACDIKDPLQNIEWTPPEGGGGPSYTLM